LDLLDAKKSYIKENVVSSCIQCKLMKANKTLKTFYNICEHISIYNKLFGNKVISKVNKVISKDIDLNLSEDQIENFLSKKCNLCGNFVITSDDDNLSNSCNICETMKNNLTNKQFLMKCLMITLKKKGIYFKTDNSTNDIKNLENLIKENYKIERKNINDYSFSQEEKNYRKNTWNGNFELLKNIKIKLEVVNNKELKDLWLYFFNKFSSSIFMKTYNINDNDLLLLVKDIDQNRYLGIMSFSEIYENNSLINSVKTYISKEENININVKNFIKLSVCIPLQPFGYHFTGGKLMAKLAFSDEMITLIENKFKNKLFGIIAMNLTGKSMQYDRMKELKFIGYSNEKINEVPDELKNTCQKYLLNQGYDFSKREEFFVVDNTLKKLNIDNKIYLSDIPFGIYLGFTHPNTKDYLTNKIFKLDDYENKSIQEIYLEWLYRWAYKRYYNLKNNNRLQYIRNNPILVFEKSKEKRRNSCIY
jgi:hypothetical protein